MAHANGRRRRAVVVGGGLGGLTAAVALHRAGWRVDVLEQASALEPVGAGIAVAPNALRVLDALGLGAQVRERSAIQGPAGFRTPDGRWLLRMNVTALTTRLGDPVVLLPRAVLVDLLRAQLPPAAVHLGTAVTAVAPGGASQPAVVHTGDSPAVHTGGARPGQREADLVVVADGARSRLRAALFPAHPGLRYAGYTAWRFLLDGQDGEQAAAGWPGEPFETWGRGQRFSALPMAGGAMYCWATARVPPGEIADDEQAELLARFGAWHTPIPGLIRRARSVLRHDVVELTRPLPPMHVGRTALLGDAAHAMTPDLGQGGGQALEDAVVLAHTLVTGSSAVPTALARYSAARGPRAARIAALSRRTGRVGQADGALATALRSGALRAAGRLPPRLVAGTLRSVTAWSPPSLPDVS